MSAMKTSQIHDGFATVRSRGLQRSRSRVEQLERLKPMSMKSDSMPLYENPSNFNNNNNVSKINNNHLFGGPVDGDHDHKLVYKFESFSGPDSSLVSDIMQNEASHLKSVHDFHSDHVPATPCTSFKSSNGSLLPGDQCNGSENNDRLSLPPPSPCYESHSNGFHTPKTPDSLHNSDYFLYSRPTSPLYERFIGGRIPATNISSSPDTTASSEIYSSSPPPKLFTASYYRKGNDTGEYALQKIAKKSPLSFKTQSLQYRKSYSHPSQTIYETTGAKYDRNIRDYYNPSTNYYDPSEMGYAAYCGRKQNANSSEILSASEVEPATEQSSRNGYERRYATLAHPRDMQRYQSRQQQQQQRKYATNQFSASQTDVDYLDPLDCKIGCQTTLRSKPQIPWYELAIKKGNRRQSCPPFQVNLVFFSSVILSFFVCLFVPFLLRKEN